MKAELSLASPLKSPRELGWLVLTIALSSFATLGRAGKPGVALESPRARTGFWSSWGKSLFWVLVKPAVTVAERVLRLTGISLLAKKTPCFPAWRP